jgi:metal-dependent amidase/aminoacylase/carboxypeptidase family protein
MANKGAFDDLDVALAIGLGPINMTGLATLTAQELVMTFKGKAAHAQAKPHTGQNALKACIATFNLIDMLRQQMKQDVRINGIILDGGETPGAIPERSVAHFNIGCLDGNEHRQLFDQIKSCAVAACQATCCKVEFEAGLVFQEMKLNPTLINIIESKMEEVGLEVSKNRDINGGTGHTDVGNVSQVVAADNIFIEMGADLMPHTVEYREACRSELGHNAIMNGARVGALCGLEIFTHPELVEAIHKDFNG